MIERLKEMLSSLDYEMINLGLSMCYPYNITWTEINEINKQIRNGDIGIYREPSNIPSDIKQFVFYKRWSVAGASGGNCWGDEAEYYEGDDEPDMLCLEMFLKKFGKEDHYDKIVSKYQHEIDYNINQYYGNYISYEIRYILFTDVIGYLKSLE